MILETFLLFCLVLCAYGLGRAILPVQGKPGGSHAFTALFLGLLLLTFCYILLASFEYASRISVSILVLGAGAGAWAFKATRSTPLPDWSPVLCFVGAVIALPTFLQGVMMSGGSFPPVFYNVDNAYFLQFVHSFLDLGKYPPPRLDNYELPAHGYHYGVMALGALIAQFTGMAPHTAFLLWVAVFGIAAFVASINALLKALNVDSVRERALILIVLAPGLIDVVNPTVRMEYLINHPVGTAKIIVKALWLEGIDQGMDHKPYTIHLASLYGLTLCFLAMSFTLAREQRRHPSAYLLVVSMMPLIKTPYMGFLGIGIGCYAVYRFIRNRDWKELFVPVVAGISMLIVFYVFGASSSTPTGGFIFGYPGGIERNTHDTVMIFILSGILVFSIAGLWRRVPRVWAEGLSFFVPLLILAMFLKVEQRNANQLFTLLPWMATLYLALICVRAAAHSSVPGKLAASVVLVPLVLLSSLGLGNYIGTLISQPEAGYEYVDNRPLADVLQNLPPQDSLLVTNDLRYPADDFARDKRQFQLAALFGHKFFGAELVYSRAVQTRTEKNRAVYADRLKAARAFSNGEWDTSAIDSLVSRYPITHLLIHHPFPHPEEIPLHLVAENFRYRLYSFERNKTD